MRSEEARTSTGNSNRVAANKKRGSIAADDKKRNKTVLPIITGAGLDIYDNTSGLYEGESRRLKYSYSAVLSMNHYLHSLRLSWRRPSRAITTESGSSDEDETGPRDDDNKEEEADDDDDGARVPIEALLQRIRAGTAAKLEEKEEKRPSWLLSPIRLRCQRKDDLDPEQPTLLTAAALLSGPGTAVNLADVTGLYDMANINKNIRFLESILDGASPPEAPAATRHYIYHCATIVYDTYLPFIANTAVRGDVKRVIQPLDPIFEHSLPHYADVVREVMLTSEPAVSRPVYQILWKLFPRAAMSRRFAPILQSYMADPIFKRDITEIMLCSLLGNYRHCDPTTRADRGMRLALYAAFMPRTFEGYVEGTGGSSSSAYGLGQEQQVHIRNLLHNSSIPSLLLLVLREYLIYIIDSDPAIRSQANALFDYDGMFRPAVLGATASARVYIRNNLKPVYVDPATGATHRGTMVNDLIYRLDYATELEHDLVFRCEAIAKNGSFRKSPPAPLQLIRHAKGRVPPTLKWAERQNTPVHYCADPTPEEKGTDTRLRTRIKRAHRDGRRARQAVNRVLADHDDDAEVVESNDEDDDTRDYAQSLAAKRRIRNTRVQIASEKLTFESDAKYWTSATKTIAAAEEEEEEEEEEGKGEDAPLESAFSEMTIDDEEEEDVSTSLETAFSLLNITNGRQSTKDLENLAKSLAAAPHSLPGPAIAGPAQRRAATAASSSSSFSSNGSEWRPCDVNGIPDEKSLEITRDCILSDHWTMLNEFISHTSGELSPTDAFAAILGYLPVVGGRPAGIERLRDLCLEHCEGIGTLKAWEKQTRELRDVHGYTYNLLQAAASLWYRHSRVFRRKLPLYRLRYQCEAIRQRYGIPAAKDERNLEDWEIEYDARDPSLVDGHVPIDIPYSPTQFLFCGVCDKIYNIVRKRPTNYRRGKKRPKPLRMYGNLDAGVDLLDGEKLYCKKNRCIGSKMCGDQELVSLTILGYELRFRGKSYAICGQPNCGLVAMIEPGYTLYNKYGLACYQCAEAVRGKYVELPVSTKVICSRLGNIRVAPALRATMLQVNPGLVGSKRAKAGSTRGGARFPTAGTAKRHRTGGEAVAEESMGTAATSGGGDSDNDDTDMGGRPHDEGGVVTEVADINTIKPIEAVRCYLCGHSITSAPHLFLYGTNTFVCYRHRLVNDAIRKYVYSFVQTKGLGGNIIYSDYAEGIYREALTKYREAYAEAARIKTARIMRRMQRMAERAKLTGKVILGERQSR